MTADLMDQLSDARVSVVHEPSAAADAALERKILATLMQACGMSYGPLAHPRRSAHLWLLSAACAAIVLATAGVGGILLGGHQGSAPAAAHTLGVGQMSPQQVGDMGILLTKAPVTVRPKISEQQAEADAVYAAGGLGTGALPVLGSAFGYLNVPGEDIAGHPVQGYAWVVSLKAINVIGGGGVPGAPTARIARILIAINANNGKVLAFVMQGDALQAQAAAAAAAAARAATTP